MWPLPPHRPPSSIPVRPLCSGRCFELRQMVGEEEEDEGDGGGGRQDAGEGGWGDWDMSGRLGRAFAAGYYGDATLLRSLGIHLPP